MSAHCGDHDPKPSAAQANSPRYRKILWIALAVNLVMFGIEIGAGLKSGSVSLLADAVDFFGDAANYGVTLAVLSLGLAWREGDANMRSVWLCSRNDAIGSLAVMLAALGVFGTGSAWLGHPGPAPRGQPFPTLGLLRL